MPPPPFRNIFFYSLLLSGLCSYPGNVNIRPMHLFFISKVAPECVDLQWKIISNTFSNTFELLAIPGVMYFQASVTSFDINVDFVIKIKYVPVWILTCSKKHFFLCSFLYNLWKGHCLILTECWKINECPEVTPQKSGADRIFTKSAVCPHQINIYF